MSDTCILDSLEETSIPLTGCADNWGWSSSNQNIPKGAYEMSLFQCRGVGSHFDLSTRSTDNKATLPNSDWQQVKETQISCRSSGLLGSALAC